MAAVIAYTLPTMQLVCHLVASGTSGIDVTNSVPATTQLPPQYQATPLPDGYVAYPDIGVALKYHSADLTWVEARNVCIQEGARLAVIDSAKKMAYIGLQQPNNWLLSGFVRIDDTWINVNTGKSEPPITVWQLDQPSGSGDCAQFYFLPQGLRNFACSDAEDFYCELSIFANSTPAAN